MKYWVRFRIDARYETEVEADSLEEAKELATDNYIDADLGEARDIEGEIVSVEDADGNYLFEI